MRRINFKFLLILIIGLFVVAGSFYGLRQFQVSRNAGSKLEMARASLKEGKVAEALALFGSYVALRPGDHAAFAEYSKLLLGRATAADATRNDVARAFNTLETAVLRNPDDDDLRQQLAEFQLRVGRATDAREHLAVLEGRLADPPADSTDPEAAKKRAEKASRVKLLKASSYLASSESEEAAQIAAGLVGYDLAERRFVEAAEGEEAERQEAETDAYVMLAAILLERMASPDDARQVLERLVERKADQPQAWLAMSNWRRQQGEVDQAKAAIAKALEIAPDDPGCVFAEFEISLLAREFDRAHEIGRRAVELFPNDERAYRGLAAVSLQQGDLPGAERVLLEGVERLPGQASLMMMLTDTLLQQNKLEEAAQAITRISELYGSTSGPVGLLEARLLVAERRWNEAKTKLEEVRPLVLGNVELVRQVDLYLGQCHAQLDEYDSQLQVNQRILTEDPGSLAARAGAAQALLSAGKTDAALTEFEAIAAGIPEAQLLKIPQVWYPLLQLRINGQASLPREERDWSGVDDLLDALSRSNAVQPGQMAMLRAEALVRRGEQEAARELLESVASDSDDPQLWSALVTLALRLGDADAARDVLARVPESAKDAPPLLLIEAQIIARSPPAEARVLLDGLEKRVEPLDPEAAARVLAAIASLRQAAGDREGAERAWQAAAEKRPEDLAFREAMLDLAVSASDLAKGRKVAEKIGEIAGPGSARARVAEASLKLLEARLELAEAKAEAQKKEQPLRELPEPVRLLLDEARNSLIEAENERPGWSQIQILFAEAENLRGNVSGSIDRLRRAVALGPASPAVIRRLVALLYATNRLEEAQEAMSQLGQDASEGLERISAEVELRAGKFDEAVALAEQSVAGDTQNYEDLLWLGQLLARSGKAERAGEVLQQAAELAPDEPEIWLALFTHRMSGGNQASAEAALERAAELMPEPRRQLVLAQGYEMLGRMDDAERMLDEAVASHPDDVGAIQGLAAFQIRKGRSDEARTLIDKILAAPDDAAAATAKPWARRAMAELEGRRGTYRQLQRALEMLAKNRGDNSEVSAEDLSLEINLLSERPEPASWRRAITLLDELAGRQNLTTAERLLRAQLREKVGDWDTARNELVAIVASPKTPPAYVALLIEKLIEHGELSTAKTWMRRLEKAAPDSTITAALQAKLAIVENDRQQAAEFARRLMPAGEITADKAAQLGAVGRLMEDLGFPKAADRVFEQYAAVAIPGLAARVEFLGREGRTDEALDLLEARWDDLSLERALSLALQVLRTQADETAVLAAAGRIEPWLEKGKRVDPGSMVIPLLEAELRTLLNRQSEAEVIYRELLERKDLAAGQRAIIANNLAFHLAKPATAAEGRKLIDTAIEELGPLPDLLDTRGLVRLAGGDAAGAVEDLREAILDPSAVKFLHLAAAELAAGDSTAARRALESARSKGLAKLRLMPEDTARLKTLERELGPAAGSTAAAEQR